MHQLLATDALTFRAFHVDSAAKQLETRSIGCLSFNNIYPGAPGRFMLVHFYLYAKTEHELKYKKIIFPYVH